MLPVTEQQVKVSAQRKMERWPEKVNNDHRRIVEEAGAVYECGMLGDLVMFTSPRTGSTLALHQDQLTVDAVRGKLLESHRAFGLQ